MTQFSELFSSCNFRDVPEADVPYHDRSTIQNTSTTEFRSGSGQESWKRVERELKESWKRLFKEFKRAQKELK